MEDKKKKVTVIIISVLIVLILLLALTYAYFSTQLSGSDQIVKVGELELVLDETSEGISLDNAVGISDSKGMSLEGSTFELINNGSQAVDYTIYLDDNTIGETDTRIDDKYLKYNLNKNGNDSGATLLTKIGSNPNRILDSGTIEGKTTNKYKLNLWITDEVDGNYSGQVFSGKLRVEVSQERDKSVATVIMSNLGDNGSTYDDGTDTFITGTNPNNYIWYSGKLWRAVSINNEEKTVKLVTQWNISAINYDDDSSIFEGSHMQQWLNDTSVDGFLGNLRDYENFIVTDAKWDATMDATDLGNITRPNGTSISTNAVGLLNIYEYQESFRGTNYSYGYLNNKLMWWTLTPNTSSNIRLVNHLGIVNSISVSDAYGVRPSVVLKSDVKIVSGDGTGNNPYRLEGDYNDSLKGTKLNTRYSGEYITFGTGENNLYQIVSHETEGLTKITAAEPLKKSGTFITSMFGDTATFSNTNTIGTFLNGDYLINYVDNKYSDMIENNTTWYLGTVSTGDSYKLAKYTDTSMSTYTTSTDSKIGLLRSGELMAGQFNSYDNNANYWILTPSNLNNIIRIMSSCFLRGDGSVNMGSIKPSLNLKSNVVITSGDGTKNNPFTLALN